MLGFNLSFKSAACTICCLNNRQNSASRKCLVSIYRLEQRLVQFAKLNNRQIQRETINIKIVKKSLKTEKSWNNKHGKSLRTEKSWNNKHGKSLRKIIFWYFHIIFSFHRKTHLRCISSEMLQFNRKV